MFPLSGNDSMKNKELAYLIQEFERRHFNSYQKFLIRGFFEWQVIKRPMFYGLIRQQISSITSNRRKKNFFSELILPFLAFPFKLIATRIKKGKNTVLVVTHGIYKFDKTDDGKLINNFGDHWYHLAGPGKAIFTEYSLNNQPGAIPRDFDINFIGTITRLITSLALKLGGNRNSSKYFAAALKEHLPLQVSEEQYRRMISSSRIKFLTDYYFFSFIFRVLKPRIVVVTDAVATGLMAAANRRKIIVIENQHGHFDENKADYVLNRETVGQYPDKLIRPDFIAVFGNFFREAMMRFSIWKEEQVVPVGNVRIDRYRKQKENVSASEELKILIPTQWPLFEDTKKLLAELAKISLARPFVFIIKLHPREPASHLEWFEAFVSANPRFRLSRNESNLYELFLSADLVIGFDSTALYEAVAMGLPTVTLPTAETPRGIHTYIKDPAIETAIKLAEPGNIDRMLHQWVEQASFRIEWQDAVTIAGNYLYRNNCIDNCNALLQKIK